MRRSNQRPGDQQESSCDSCEWTPLYERRAFCNAEIPASGQATATPPSAASNSRRPMVTVIRPSRARCVTATIPRRERAVLTTSGSSITRISSARVFGNLSGFQRQCCPTLLIRLVAPDAETRCTWHVSRRAAGHPELTSYHCRPYNEALTIAEDDDPDDE